MVKDHFQTEAVTFDVHGDGDFVCEIRSKMGRYARVRKLADTEKPEVIGDELLTSNESLLNSLWMAAVAYQAAQNTDDELQKETFLAQATDLGKVATFLAETSDQLIDEFEEGYCSHCFAFARHRRARDKRIFVCQTCGNVTQHCVIPGCAHFATKFQKLENMSSLCAEHRHDIPDFEKANDQLADLAEFRDLFQYKSPNMIKSAKYLAGGVAALGIGSGLAFAAAPAIGGMVGTTFLGLSGAAATNAGLATLGFGSLASGGLGMAGGTMVVTAAGGMLGTAFGTKISSAWISEDKSFNITKLREGSGCPVLIARGFTTEKSLDWRSPVRAVEKAYPESPIYLVEWGSKELKDLAAAVGIQAGGAWAGRFVKTAVSKASKAAAKVAAPLTPVLAAVDLASNPWHVAVSRAKKTGMTLATLIKKANISECILVGHSLGGRVMINVALALSSEDVPMVRSMYLFGAAMGQQKEWEALEKSVSGKVHNYHSRNDAVLTYLYPIAQFGKTAVGRSGFQASSGKIVDHDVSESVLSHSAYYECIDLDTDEE